MHAEVTTAASVPCRYVIDHGNGRRIAEKLEIHYTPKHGSWLNVAEIELRVLTVQCLNRRIADSEILRLEVRAWEASRNASDATVDWQFTADDARVHLKQLYPRIKA
jgi:uncharacterized small protein (DUF1192 family)